MTKIRTRNGSTIVTALALCMSVVAAAAEPHGAVPPAFSVHDLNHDGYLDRAEYGRLQADCHEKRSGRGRRPCVLEFAAIDADGDNRIGEEELLAALPRGYGRVRWRGGVQPLPDEPTGGGSGR
jgi:hypothetical protein